MIDSKNIINVTTAMTVEEALEKVKADFSGRLTEEQFIELAASAMFEAVKEQDQRGKAARFDKVLEKLCKAAAPSDSIENRVIIVIEKKELWYKYTFPVHGGRFINSISCDRDDYIYWPIVFEKS
ncbi:hypothetical protein DFR58_1462 [Anaerobacterium chartisolvens]|uniref:Uncharacterized protein n=1 Tax=Anaerobacterium chartisolvens TaxID=1297424 RepID=A0A369AIV1_9FIRM|nr:hypothetical protein [Anaerobacterium chartisolvens]RCX08077.1 hypothetical protein DFR58_1462 [Anaerobacterium chartisolvens]